MRTKFDIYISDVSLQLLFNIRSFELNFQLTRIIKKLFSHVMLYAHFNNEEALYFSIFYTEGTELNTTSSICIPQNK